MMVNAEWLYSGHEKNLPMKECVKMKYLIGYNYFVIEVA